MKRMAYISTLLLTAVCFPSLLVACGGSSEVGGAAGASTSMGGQTATGGTTGVLATGGLASTGGTVAGTGGVNATGGSATSQPTGGAASGGAASGGAASGGASSAIGGSSNTGGSSLGLGGTTGVAGGSATGGSTSPTTAVVEQTCEDVCSLLATRTTPLACVPADCVGTCNSTHTKLYGAVPACGDDYFAMLQCGVNQPADTWTCYPVVYGTLVNTNIPVPPSALATDPCYTQFQQLFLTIMGHLTACGGALQ